jgi:hypothetical protein
LVLATPLWVAIAPACTSCKTCSDVDGTSKRPALPAVVPIAAPEAVALAVLACETGPKSPGASFLTTIEVFVAPSWWASAVAPTRCVRYAVAESPFPEVGFGASAEGDGTSVASAAVGVDVPSDASEGLANVPRATMAAAHAAVAARRPLVAIFDPPVANSITDQGAEVRKLFRPVC